MDDQKNLDRATALKAYRACKTEEERHEVYWQHPVLRGIISEVTHHKVLPSEKSEHDE